MGDPRDEELRRRGLEDRPGDEDGAEPGAGAEPAEREAFEREWPERESLARDPAARPALSDEIARRWDPRRLLRSVNRDAGTGAPLDATTRGYFERRLGVDLGGVRVYTGDFAEKVTARHSAEAVTVGGTGMIFMSGSPDRSPATAAGHSLLAHELTHVAQASRGIYRSAPGEAPPLATEHHEREAHQFEAEEQARAEGGGKKGQEKSPEQLQQELTEVVSARVLELLYDDERVHALRNGDPRFRP